MRRLSTCFLLCALILVAFQGIGSAHGAILHNFAGATGDGANPRLGALVSDGSALYGMTYDGGASNYGTIFRIDIDGSNFGLLHSFEITTSDGGTPYGSLILDGSTLYGMAYRGGSSDYGVIFSIDTDGSNFELLHSFASGASDGASPIGSLILDGGALYGMTCSGGASNSGTIFRIDIDGSNFGLLHSFAGGTGDGDHPYGDFVLDGGTLYGMTYTGGASGFGAIFKMNTDGSGFELLHSFEMTTSDGGNPYGSLILDGSTLYGMACYGGAYSYGVIFSIDTDGSNFELLHSFASGASDGATPIGSLILDGGALYGMTCYGGASDYGVIFTMSTDGSDYELLHSFAGGTDDGMYPYGSLTLDGSTLYGMTYRGGSSDYGVIFSLEIGSDTTTQPIPTLSEWGVIILAALLALAALAVINRKTFKSGRIA